MQSGLRQCSMCNSTVDVLRVHVETADLPWQFHPNTTCWLCNQQFGDMPALRAHLAAHSGEDRKRGKFAPHFVGWAYSMIELLETTRRMALIHTLEELVVLFQKRGWYPKQGSRSNMGMCAMLSEMMGRPTSAVDIQLYSPNHPVSLLNWDSMGRMLAEMPPNKQDSFREWLVPSMLPQTTHTVGESAMDVHCHLQLLQVRE